MDINKGTTTHCGTVHIVTYHWQLVLNLAYVLPEDGTLAPKQDGDTSVIFILHICNISRSKEL